MATLRLTKSALAAVHRSTGHQDPTDNEGVRKVMAGIARVNGCPQRQAKPLTEIALLSVLRDGLLRRSEASALRWGDVEMQEDGSARIHVCRSKTDPEAEGAVLYIGPDAAAALVSIMPEGFAVWTRQRRCLGCPPARSAVG